MNIKDVKGCCVDNDFCMKVDNGVLFMEVGFLDDLLKIINEDLDEEECCSCCHCVNAEEEVSDQCWDEAVRLLMEDEPDVNDRYVDELEIEDVIYSGPATIIKWDDGDKTIVKCEPGEEYNREKGFVMAYLKKILGNRLFKELDKWVWSNPRANYEEKNLKRKIAQGKVKVEEIPAENVLEKIASEIGVTINYDERCADATNVAEIDNNGFTGEEFVASGDITLVTPVTCTDCGIEYSATDASGFAACPECGVITRIEGDSSDGIE